MANFPPISIATATKAGLVKTGTGLAVTSDGTLNTVIGLSITAINYSGSIAVASASQMLIAANSLRSGFTFQNSSAYPMAINKMGNSATFTAGNIIVMAGQTYTSRTGTCGGNQINVVCGRGSNTTSAFGSTSIVSGQTGAPTLSQPNFFCVEYTGIITPRTYTDRSGVIVSANISQIIMPANTSRLGIIFQNLSKYPIFIQEILSSGLNGISKKITPYEILTEDIFGTSTSQFNIICRYPNVQYTALEF